MFSETLIKLINQGCDILKYKNSIIDLLNLTFNNTSEQFKEWCTFGILALIEGAICHTEACRDYQNILMDIESNYKNKNFSLKILAKNINISQRTIKFIIAQNNTSFRVMLSELRCKNMRQLIYNTEGTLENISWTSGFTSYATAKRNFITHYGKTPKEYRYMLKNR